MTKPDVTGAVSGGSARLADGADSYTLVTTVKDTHGKPLAGLLDRLSAVASDQAVTVEELVDNGDGTYSASVTSSLPGNYTVDIRLSGRSLGLVPVNFIGADIEIPSLSVGAEQSARGLGFLPGEKVTVTVHSDPISLGQFRADDAGTVPVQFLAKLAVGQHAVEFSGEVSGTVTVPFEVLEQTSAVQAADNVPTGGSVSPASFQADLALAACVLMAVGFSLVMVRRRMGRS